MVFSELDRRRSGLTGQVAAVPYDDVQTVVPLGEFDAVDGAVCIFNPIRRATGEILPWWLLDPGAPRTAIVERVHRAANLSTEPLDDDLVSPLLGVPDQAVWAVLDRILAHGPVKAALFPVSDPSGLELEWAELSRRLAVNDHDAPVLWWSPEHRYIVATPWESAITYVCGSSVVIDRLEEDRTLELQRLHLHGPR